MTANLKPGDVSRAVRWRHDAGPASLESCKERRLALGRAFYEALVAMMREPALVAGPDGLAVHVNKAFCSRFSVQPDALEGKPLSEACGLFDVGAVPAEGERLFSAVIRNGAGKAENMAGRVRAVTVDGGIAGYCLVFDDLAPSRRRKQAYELEAMKFVIEEFPYGVIIWDNENKLFAANAKARERYGEFGINLERGDHRYRVLERAMRAGLFGGRYKGLEKSFEALLDRVTHKGPLADESVRIEHIAGDRWLKLMTFVSRANWTIAVYEDIVGVEPGDEKFQHLGFYFKSILQYLPDFLVHVGSHGLIKFVNESFAEALAKPVRNLIGQSAEMFLNDALGQPMQEMLGKASPLNPRFSYDQRWQEPGGDFNWLRWSVLALFDNGKPAGFIATGRDITVEYRQQMNLRHQSEELEKKNRSLEQFAAVVSHDLKAPLRHVAIFSDMIMEEAGKGNLADVNTYAGQVRQSVLRMDRVIRRLLEYSQIAYKIATMSRVNLADIVIQAIQNLESQIEEARAEILLSKLPEIKGDPDLLRHLMQNLIANAVKYRRTGTPPRIRVFAVENGSLLNICIEDNGIGIDPKYAERIFTAFQRLHKDDKVYEGFGIGLALCRQIAESHQGTIELDTSYRTGARFVVKLPHNLMRLE